MALAESYKNKNCNKLGVAMATSILQVLFHKCPKAPKASNPKVLDAKGPTSMKLSSPQTIKPSNAQALKPKKPQSSKALKPKISKALHLQPKCPKKV